MCINAKTYPNDSANKYKKLKKLVKINFRQTQQNKIMHIRNKTNISKHGENHVFEKNILNVKQKNKIKNEEKL